jgi:hypothetical protein
MSKIRTIFDAHQSPVKWEALESVIENKTGIFFDEQSAKSVKLAAEWFDVNSMPFN